MTDLPHHLSFAIMYRKRIDSFNELPKAKRPPRNLWDKPHRLQEFLDKIWETDDNKKKDTGFVYDYEDVE